MAEKNVLNKEAGATATHESPAGKLRMHAKTIIGYGIRSPQGEDLGKIDNQKP